jgi:hypothetical protein
MRPRPPTSVSRAEPPIPARSKQLWQPRLLRALASRASITSGWFLLPARHLLSCSWAELKLNGPFSRRLKKGLAFASFGRRLRSVPLKRNAMRGGLCGNRIAGCSRARAHRAERPGTRPQTADEKARPGSGWPGLRGAPTGEGCAPMMQELLTYRRRSAPRCSLGNRRYSGQPGGPGRPRPPPGQRWRRVEIGR